MEIFFLKNWVKRMPVFDSKRKVQEFGSSLAITLPALFVKGNEIEKGCDATTIFGFEGILIATWIEDHESLKKVLYKMIEEYEKKQERKSD